MVCAQVRWYGGKKTRRCGLTCSRGLKCEDCPGEDGRGAGKAIGPSSGEKGEAKVSVYEAEGWAGREVGPGRVKWIDSLQ